MGRKRKRGAGSVLGLGKRGVRSQARAQGTAHVTEEQVKAAGHLLEVLREAREQEAEKVPFWKDPARDSWD